MKQLLQNYSTGKLKVEDVPAPTLLPGGALVKTLYSAVSVGTERAMLSFAKQSMLGKARKRPDLVRQVIAKARTDGVLSAYRAARERLDRPMPLGYSSAGHVLEVSQEVAGLSPGDLVACAGDGYASHSEVVFVPQNLMAKVPANVPVKEAAFATLGAIALQGIRRAELTLGECVAVIGLGLIGLLTVQILKAYGFPVLGIDINPMQVELAKKLGIDAGATIGKDDVNAATEAFTSALGIDAVLITAATESNEPLKMAGEIVRERGRVVALGDVGMHVPRRVYYEKEVDLRISRSTGPGRYDPSYEELGIDYPIAYARWTEKRNIEEFLRLLSMKRVDVQAMITHTFPIANGEEAYHLVIDNPNKERFTGVLLEYDDDKDKPSEQHQTTIRYKTARRPANASHIAVALIGGGDFARGVILPELKRLPEARLRAICTATGASADHIAKKYDFEYATTDYHQVLDDDSIDLVVIATRHALHAPIVVEALQKGKHVFVEKPLAMNLKQLRLVSQAALDADGLLMVGFNRRFAPTIQRVQERLSGRSSPLLMHYRVNAGHVPAQSWVLDPLEGGGRIIGEVCHFVDLVRFLAGSRVKRVYATQLRGQNEVAGDESVNANLEMEDGSTASITYVTVGDKFYQRERIECFWEQTVCVIDNFKSLTISRSGKAKHMKRWNVDRGHRREIEALIKGIIQGDVRPFALEEYVDATLVTFAIVDSLKKLQPVSMESLYAKVHQ